jgi:hypothetical protein
MSGVDNSEELIEHETREMEVIRFLYELKKRQMDRAAIQQMLFNQQQQTQSTSLAAEATENQIPEPKIVFQYTRAPETPPTSSAASDSHDSSSDEREIDAVSSSFPQNEPKSAESDRDENVRLEPVKMYGSTDLFMNSNERIVTVWKGSSIYAHLPNIVLSEYDKILQEYHSRKVKTIKRMNKAVPVKYDYNPKKSRIRTNYSDPLVADDRAKNNIASRRSRHRKKFFNQIIQYSNDYDSDETFTLLREREWMLGQMSNYEDEALRKCSAQKILDLRKELDFY